MSDLKKKIVSGVLWQGLERFGSTGISFVIQIVLARLLAPREFGIIAIMMVFVNLCNVFVDSGFSAALIQKKDISESDCSSVFFINVAVALALYALFFAMAPLISVFFQTQELTVYFRFLALVPVIRSLSLVHAALLVRRMLFRLSFKITWTALVISGATSLIMAWRGFGVWALVAQQLTMALVTTLMQWILIKWYPHLIFEWSRIVSLFKFGWKLLVSAALEALYNDIYALIIGKIANLTELSFYHRGKMIPQFGVGVINSTVGSVLFPAFSQLQDDRRKMKELAVRGIRNLMFFIIPALVLLFILAEPLVIVLLSKKWLPCAIYLRLSCVIFFYWPLHVINLKIITACGRSDVFLWLEIIKKTQLAILVFAVYRYGVLALVVSEMVLGMVCFFENAWFNRRLINYAPWQQLADIMPMLCSAILSGAVSIGAVYYITSVWCKLFAGGAIFVVLYIVILFIIRQIPRDILNVLDKCKMSLAPNR